MTDETDRIASMKAIRDEMKELDVYPLDLIEYLSDEADEELEELTFSDPKTYRHTETNINLLATEARMMLMYAVERIRKVKAMERKLVDQAFKDQIYGSEKG